MASHFAVAFCLFDTLRHTVMCHNRVKIWGPLVKVSQERTNEQCRLWCLWHSEQCVQCLDCRALFFHLATLWKLRPWGLLGTEASESCLQTALHIYDLQYNAKNIMHQKMAAVIFVHWCLFALPLPLFRTTCYVMCAQSAKRLWRFPVLQREKCYLRLHS